MTGDVNAKLRVQIYKEKWIFFMTPQTLQNDIDKEIFDL